MSDIRFNKLNAFRSDHEEIASGEDICMSKRLSIAEEKVLKVITENEREIIGFLRSILKIPSVTGNECEVQQFVAEKFDSMSLEIDMWEPDVEELKKHVAYCPKLFKDFRNRPVVVGKLKSSGHGRSMLLNGHVDVVDPGPTKEWTYDPWSAHIENDRVYGRGASDMKGGVAAIIMALDCILKAGIDLGGDVIVESVPDEEGGAKGCGGSGGTLSCVLRGYTADAGVVAEPTELVIAPVSRGVLLFKIEVKGRAAHAARAELGVSAIGKAAKIYNSLVDLQSIRKEDRKHPLLAKYPLYTPVIVGMFTAGNVATAVPGECVMKGEIGITPGETVSEVKRQFEEHIQKTCELDPWLRNHSPNVEYDNWAGSSEIPADHPIVEVFSRAYQRVTSRNAVVEGVPYSSDVWLLTNYGDTPSITFGPGSIAQAHGRNEFVSLRNIITATRIFALSILGWCGANS
jgi:acetylornithine deacetylase